MASSVVNLFTSGVGKKTGKEGLYMFGHHLQDKVI